MVKNPFWYAQENPKEWVMNYLYGSGNNSDLAQGIEYYARNFVFINDYPIKLLNFIVGPAEGPNIDYVSTQWHSKVEDFKQLLNDGVNFPPLISIDFLNPHPQLDLADGNHRAESMLQNGQKTHSVVFCLKHNWSVESLLNGY